MKKKNQETVEQLEQQETAQKTNTTTVNDAPNKENLEEDVLDSQESVEKAPKEDIAERPEQQETNNARIDAILKLYPQYEKVYIDSRGFVFTVDTPKNQRNDAVLYKNKYYKK